jgi:protoporphyrinogen oxidase
LHIGIIGGGISGLSAAYWLLKAGERVTIFEAGPEVGGLASSVEVQGAYVDKFYHCILPSDTALLSLVEELGMGENIYWQETEMGFLHRGDLYPLTTPIDLLKFSPLSLTDRLRVGLTGLYGRYLRDWRALEKITAKDWLIRLCGERAFNTIWKPLLVFKFGDRWQEAPATYLWARVKRQGTTRKGRSSKELLAYVKGGFKVIIEKLAEEVRRLGGTIQTETKVEKVEIDGNRVKGLTIHGDFVAFDKVISTVPIAQFLKLVDPNVLDESFRHGGVAYHGAVCVMMVLKERLSRYYWIPAVDSGVSFSGIVETTNLIRREDLGGINLVYLVNYVPREDPLFLMEPGSLISRSTKELESNFPTFRSDQILEAHVFKAAFVEPLWTLNYSLQMPHRVLLDDSLFVLTTAQLYPEINSTSNCIQQVRDVLHKLTTPVTAAPERNS